MAVVRKSGGSFEGGRFAAQQRAEVETNLFFHVAPVSAHESIEEHGLDHSIGDSAYANTSLDYPPGNYLFTDPDAAASYAEMRAEEELDEYGSDAEDYDVYEVQLPTGARFQVDPFADDESGLGATAVFSTDPIPAENVRLIG